MKKSHILSLAFAIILAACAKVPLTGRKQLNLIPSQQIISMSFDNYQQVLKDNKLSSNQSEVKMVQNVGTRIQHAVETYMANNGLKSRLDGYQWEFHLIQDDNTVNAWCMPGGKVAVYTGIMPVCQDDKGLAVVLGHEIAHAVARHGNERMSEALVQQLGGVALAVALKDQPEKTQGLFMAAYGVGSTVGVMLPFSRLQESEADHLGLIFMAMAGYDPHEAIDFWQRMEKQGGKTPPEFLSTHPSHSTRIEDLKKWMPEAMKYYKK